MATFIKSAQQSWVAALLVAAMLVLAVPGIGEAASVSTSTEVSCDGITWKAGVQRAHSGGNMSIKQTASSPTSSTVVTARSQNGNDLPVRTISNGQTGSWSSVLAGTYTVRARRSASSNCNGWLPGHGNYTWGYTFTYVA